MVNKTISIPEHLSTLLKFEENSSKLISDLLTQYYANTDLETVRKLKISQLKNEEKLIKLSVKKGKKEIEKQKDLEEMKEKFDNVLTESQIKAWEKKWA